MLTFSRLAKVGEMLPPAVTENILFRKIDILCITINPLLDRNGIGLDIPSRIMPQMHGFAF